MKLKNYLYITACIFSVATIAGCSGGAYNNIMPQPQVIISGTNGLVYQESNVLTGQYPVGLDGETMTQSGFLSSEQFVTCGFNGIVSAGENSWNLVGKSFGYISGCAFSTNPFQNDNIYFGFNNLTSNGNNAYTYKYDGSNWQPVAGGILPESGSISHVANDALGNMYVGIMNESNQPVVYVTNNGTWSQVINASLPSNTYIGTIVVMNNILYVGLNSDSSGSIYTVVDNQWESVGGGSPDGSNIYSMVTNQDGVLFVGTAAGNIYQLTGNTWQQIITPSSSPDLPIEALVIDANNNLYMATPTSVYEYLNNNWILLADNNQDTIFSLAISKSGKIVVGTKKSYAYQVNNSSWQPLVVGAASSSEILTTYANESTGMIYVGGLESSNGSSYVYGWNGSNWSIVNNSPLPMINSTFSIIRMLTSDSYNNLYAVISDIDMNNASIYESNNGQWSLVNGESLPYPGITSSIELNRNTNQIFVAETILYESVLSGVVMESVAGNWVMVNNTPISNAIHGVGPIALDKQNNLYAATGGYVNLLLEYNSAVYESVNGIWSQVSPTLLNNENIMSMAFDNNNNLYIGTFSNYSGDSSIIFSSGNVYELVKGSWKLISTQLLPANGGFVSIQFDKNNNLYASTLLGDVYTLQNGIWALSNNYNMISTSMAISYTK